jgi:hypothetical protein
MMVRERKDETRSEVQKSGDEKNLAKNCSVSESAGVGGRACKDTLKRQITSL